MIDQIALWHEEHARFARLLDLLDAQLAVFHEGGEPDYEVMRDIVWYLHEYSDRHHHPREDAAFARLVNRDPEMRLPVNRLLQEHRVIAAEGQELLRILDDIAAGAVVPRTSVEAAAATYLVYYRHHLAAEESEVIPRAAKSLTPQDWEAVAATAPVGEDPLFGEHFDARYEELRRLVVSEVQESQKAGKAP
jgi:hemerythrin-like domain-containing protein